MADISKIAKEMARAYDKSEITMHGSSLTLPDKEEIISILGDIKKLMFPAYFASGEAKGDAITFCEPLLYSIYGRIKKQISLALSLRSPSLTAENSGLTKKRTLSKYSHWVSVISTTCLLIPLIKIQSPFTDITLIFLA